ncbi:PAN domain-containing protein [Methylocystis heyeri]|uniref:TIR domain-containing protein n=1 Tax=Methylocystis heyeri TaxID=391905 RepID=A0A6B8KAD2_9HYPH|nr:PAN domain-containing protein [Methylocystis heyeri]QGM45264.1 TIR domain-containing protein [Methylocystis heyeri]
MSDVFMSYAREDEQRVAPIVEKLAAFGLRLWPAGPAGNGGSWDESEVNERLREAKAVLVCWTSHSAHSVRVNGEASVAQSSAKLVSCLLEECKAPSQFQSNDAPDLSGWNGDAQHLGWRALIEKLAALTGRPGLPALGEALGAASDRELLGWTQRFPEDPHADALRGEIEKRERSRFKEEINSAQSALSDAARLFEQSKSGVLNECSAAFEKWIGDLRNAAYDARPNVSEALSSPEWLSSGALQQLASERDAAVKEAKSAAEAREEALKRREVAHEVRDAALLKAKRAETALAAAEAEEASYKSRRTPAWILAACLGSALAGGLAYRTASGSGVDGASVEQAKQQAAQGAGELAAARDSLKIQDETIAQLRAAASQSAPERREFETQLKRKNAELEEKTEALKAAAEKVAKLEAALNAANAQPEGLRKTSAPGGAPGAEKSSTAAALDESQPRLAIKFNTFDSGDIQGKDLGKIPSPSAEDCAAACRDNPACRAYSYDKWNHICFPKSSVGSLRLEPRAISGVIQGGPNPKLATSRIIMERYRGRAFPGAGYKTPNAGKPQDCEDICRRDEACVAYTFLWSSRKCQLMESTGEYFPNQEADSGGKKQER